MSFDVVLLFDEVKMRFLEWKCWLFDDFLTKFFYNFCFFEKNWKKLLFLQFQIAAGFLLDVIWKDMLE